MRTERFTIDYPRTKAEKAGWSRLYGLNAIYAGKHWSKRNEDKQFWHMMVGSAMNRARIPRKPFEKPVSITMWWDDGLDIDNHAYMGKMIVDSLRGWLLTDDRRRYVKSVRHCFHDKGYILVEVTDDVR